MMPEGTQTKKAVLYLQVLHNRTLMVLWSGTAVSLIGDTLFNLAITWTVYTQSGSALQTAFIQVVWHLPGVLFGLLAGSLADHQNRKHIMIIVSLLNALVVGILAAALFAWGRVSSLGIFVTAFCLNSLYTFYGPASFSLMPEVIGRELFVTASGMFTVIRQITELLGNVLAGVLIAVMGMAWAVGFDALSFLIAALSIALVRLPGRKIQPTSRLSEHSLSLMGDIVDGWHALAAQPVVWSVIWLSLLINVASFLGPLTPALVQQRLHGNAVVFGQLEAVSIVSMMVGGALVGPLERRVGAGHLLVIGWCLAGLCTLGIAFSTVFFVTATLNAISAFGVITGDVAMGALMALLIPENYRGRASGITRALSVIAIPLSSLAGGWLTDRIGVEPLFIIGGAWMIGVAALAYANRHVRTARTL